MEELKSLFGDEALSYDAFEQKLTEAGDTIKLANLKTDKYVERDIYEKQKAKFEEQKSKLDEYKSKLKDYEASTEQITSLKASFEDISTKYNELLAKQDKADKMNLILEANVDKKFADYVYTKVSPEVNDDKDFQTALTEYLKENGQFLNTGRGTFVDLQNGNAKVKTANEKMNEFIRRKGR